MGNCSERGGKEREITERGIKGLRITEGWRAMATPASLDAAGVRNWKELATPAAGTCANVRVMVDVCSPRPRREEKSVCAAVRFPCAQAVVLTKRATTDGVRPNERKQEVARVTRRQATVRAGQHSHPVSACPAATRVSVPLPSEQGTP